MSAETADLVARLRTSQDLNAEAADEIERLRAMLVRIDEALCEGDIMGSTDIHDDLRDVLGL